MQIRMNDSQHAPAAIRLVHGMEHAGLSDAALRIERSRAFKIAFVNTVKSN